MSTTPLASQIHLRNPSPTNPPKRSYIIYFITGNPGLIEYYRTFLTHLYGLLIRDTSSPIAFHVFGRSLSGFETEKKTPKNDPSNPPFSLQEQIANSQEALEELVRSVQQQDGVQDVRVILMGHSVGTYILLEIIRRVRANTKAQPDGPRIVGGVCLFATVMHLAKSDSGRKATWLFAIPYFALLVSLFAKALTSMVPFSAFTLLVQKVLSFPPDAARVTAAFVASPHGVHQALHMARDELREITVDTWDAEIWGAASASPHPHPRPSLHFLFAKQDHWVADETRDELIKVRGQREGEAWKPVMEVDEEAGWEHGFCIRQSVPVAERAFKYISGIVARDVD